MYLLLYCIILKPKRLGHLIVDLWNSKPAEEDSSANQKKEDRSLQSVTSDIYEFYKKGQENEMVKVKVCS